MSACLSAALAGAREWIADVSTLDQVPQLARDDDVTVMQIIRLNVVGGWLGFLTADPSGHPGAVYVAMEQKYGKEFADAMFYVSEHHCARH